MPAGPRVPRRGEDSDGYGCATPDWGQGKIVYSCNALSTIACRDPFTATGRLICIDPALHKRYLSFSWKASQWDTIMIILSQVFNGDLESDCIRALRRLKFACWEIRFDNLRSQLGNAEKTVGEAVDSKRCCTASGAAQGTAHLLCCYL